MESLPFELLHRIASHLAPDCIDPLTLTSKRLRTVLRSVNSRHRGLKRKYGHAICDRAGSHGTMARLLVDILTQPELHFYIRKLTIKNWHNELNPGDARAHIDPEFRDSIRESAIRDSASLKCKLATLDTDGGILPLLLWELSELRTLRLAGEPDDGSILYEIMAEIEESRSHARSLFRNPFPPILQHLREVQLHRGTQDTG